MRNRAKLAWKASTDKKEILCCNPRRQTALLLWPSLPFWTYQTVVYLRIFPVLEEKNGSVDSYPHKNLLSEILFYKGRSGFNERRCYRLYLRRKCLRRDFHIMDVQDFLERGISHNISCTFLEIGNKSKSWKEISSSESLTETFLFAVASKKLTVKKKARNSGPKTTAKEFRKIEKFTVRTKLPANRRRSTLRRLKFKFPKCTLKDDQVSTKEDVIVYIREENFSGEIFILRMCKTFLNVAFLTIAPALSWKLKGVLASRFAGGKGKRCTSCKSVF
ncbi:hypothetical protein CDAR_582091, partial [Caerostris darwini]